MALGIDPPQETLGIHPQTLSALLVTIEKDPALGSRRVLTTLHLVE